MANDPQIDGTMVRTLADWHAFFARCGKPTDIIELMSETNTILDDILWREANGYDGHKTTVRNGLPQVYWRKLYRGVPVSKSSVSVIKDPVGMLEARAVIDKKMLDLHLSQAAAYRMQESRAFMEAMRQELATAIFYGDVRGIPEGIHGLAPRLAYRDAPQVVDAGGRTADGELTSIFGVVWGENEATGIFPKDTIAGLQHEALPPYDAYDDLGNAFRAVGDLYTWNVGLSLRDWRCVVRVANIPVERLMLAKGETGFVDLHRLTIMAKNMVPSEKRNRLRWYMNQDVMTGMEMQASDAGNVTLVYRKEDAQAAGPMFKSYTVAELHGSAIRQTDAILSTEEELPVAPVAP